MTLATPEPFSDDAPCRKCGFGHPEMAYEPKAHKGCALGWTWHDWPTFWLGAYTAPTDEQRAKADAVPEHLDRKCLRCGFRWAETPAEVPA